MSDEEVVLDNPVAKSFTISCYRIISVTWVPGDSLMHFVLDPCDSDHNSLGLAPRVERHSTDGSTLGDADLPQKLTELFATAAKAANVAAAKEDAGSAFAEVAAAADSIDIKGK